MANSDAEYGWMNDMKDPIVTVITPTYNHEKYIGQCIESVLKQTFPSWEQIIIDDESTDRTSEIINTYHDPRIRYHRIAHKGLSNLVQVYNEALNLARGEFIAILEGDDFWPQDKLEKEIGAFNDPKVVLAWGKGIVVDQLGRILYLRSSIKNSNIGQLQCYPARKLLPLTKRDNPFTPTCTVMIRKSSLMEIGGFQSSPSGVYVDLPTWIRLAEISDARFCFCNCVLGYWRTHPSQASFSGRALQLLDHAKIIRELNIEGAESYSKYLEANASLIAQNWVHARMLFTRLLANNDIDITDKMLCLAGLISSFIKFDLIRFIIRLKSQIIKCWITI